MSSQISFNSRHGQQGDFLLAKSRPEEAYRPGPIKITDQDSFWILASVIPDWDDETISAKDVRISFRKAEPFERETSIVCEITCEVATPQKYHSEIRFISDNPFYLELQEGSGYLYGPAGNWHSDGGRRLLDSVFSESGAPIGSDFPDGKIRGGEGNYVTVSVRVLVIRY